MSRVFWRGQQAIAFIAVIGGLIFWIGYGFMKGVEFAIVLSGIMEIPVLFDYWRRCNKGDSD